VSNDGRPAGPLARLRAAGEADSPATEADFEAPLVLPKGTEPPSATLRETAGALPPPELHSLHALHLATALRLGEDLARIVAHGERLTQAARAAIPPSSETPPFRLSLALPPTPLPT
jgi:hypothetical protein